MGWLALEFIYFQTIIAFYFKFKKNVVHNGYSTTFMLAHLDFVHSFSMYGSRSEIEQTIDSVFAITVHTIIQYQYREYF